MSEADKKNPRDRAASPGPKEKAVPNDTDAKTDKSATSFLRMLQIAARVAVKVASVAGLDCWQMENMTEYVRRRGAFWGAVMLAIRQCCLFCGYHTARRIHGPEMVPDFKIMAEERLMLLSGEILPGFLFGLWQGTIVSMVGKNLANLIALVLGRTLLRDWVKKRTKEYDILEKADAAIKHDGGFVMVLLARGLWLPVAVKNYGLAALGVSIPQKVAGAILSGLPFSLAWSFVGSTAQSLVQIAEGKKGMSDLDLSPATMVAGAVVCAGLFGVTGVYMKRAFDSAINAEEERQKKEMAQKAE